MNVLVKRHVHKTSDVCLFSFFFLKEIDVMS